MLKIEYEDSFSEEIDKIINNDLQVNFFWKNSEQPFDKS